MCKQSWAVAIGATVIQNQLKDHLSASFLSTIISAGGQDISYAAIPLISSLPQPLQDDVREVFARSIDMFWQILLAFCAVGLLSVFLQKEIPLHVQMDETWALDSSQDSRDRDVEQELVTRSIRASVNGEHGQDTVAQP